MVMFARYGNEQNAVVHSTDSVLRLGHRHPLQSNLPRKSECQSRAPAMNWEMHMLQDECDGKLQMKPFAVCKLPGMDWSLPAVSNVVIPASTKG
jgi:hypothetical protein